MALGHLRPQGGWQEHIESSPTFKEKSLQTENKQNRPQIEREALELLSSPATAGAGVRDQGRLEKVEVKRWVHITRM